MVALVHGEKVKCCLLCHTEGLEDFSYKPFHNNKSVANIIDLSGLIKNLLSTKQGQGGIVYIFHSSLVFPKAGVVRFSSLKRRLRSRRLTCFLPRAPEHNSNVSLATGSMSDDSGRSHLTTLGEALKSTYTNVLPCPAILLSCSLSLVTRFFRLP